MINARGKLLLQDLKCMTCVLPGGRQAIQPLCPRAGPATGADGIRAIGFPGGNVPDANKDLSEGTGPAVFSDRLHLNKAPVNIQSWSLLTGSGGDRQCEC